MANKFAFGLVAAGALTGICIGIGQVITEHLPSPEPTVAAADWRTKVSAATEAELEQPAPVTEVAAPVEVVGNPDPTATCEGASKLHSGCSSEQAEANRQAYWDQQQEREAEMRADCRAGRINRDTCNQLVWDWETRI